ncbi:MAG: glycosyltransferase [Candidatus Binataceae bacterium]
MASQKHLPLRWTIVDDGSTDATGEIVEAAASQHPWIRPVHLSARRQRLPGGESVIMQFLHEDALRDADYIMRLDADISFDDSFVDSLFQAFASDSKLGIAGATLYEPDETGKWHEVTKAPAFHTRGATKVYSSRCFRAIGGLESGLGWDTIDEVRALMKGFTTRSFRSIRAKHHRPQGSSSSRLRDYCNKGRCAYYVGYSPIFQLARSGRLALSSPLGSIAMLGGYIEGYLKKLPRIDDIELIRFVRRQQHRKLLMLHTLWK